MISRRISPMLALMLVALAGIDAPQIAPEKRERKAFCCRCRNEPERMPGGHCPRCGGGRAPNDAGRLAS